MAGRLFLLAFVAAVALVQTLATLPQTRLRVVLAGIALCPILIWHKTKPRSLVRVLLLCVSGFCGGAAYAMERGQSRLETFLPLVHQNQVARVTLRIASLPQRHAQGLRFNAQVLDTQPPGLPAYIRVTWPVSAEENAALWRQIWPGQQWRMALLMKRPHAAMNPDAMDGEARLFQHNIRATATVRGKPRFLKDEGWCSVAVAIARLRHGLRDRMQTALADTRYGAVMIALALGDQAGVRPDDWRVFNATGITHLVSISGLHVTLVAGLAAAMVGWLWRRIKWREQSMAERLPAQSVSLLAAIGVAGCYCLLAGWGIPARRTFFTLAIAASAKLVRLPLSTPTLLLLTAWVVTVLDPWAVLAPGFWLSFGAVAVVLAWTRGVDKVVAPADSRGRRWQQGLFQASRLQCVVTLALTPLLAFLTQQLAFTAPLANAIAIPVVSFLVTPLALLCAALCSLPSATELATCLGRMAQWIFELAMYWVVWLADRKWAVLDVAAPPAVLLGFAVVGIVWALLPPAMLSRRWAWCLLLPALCWRPGRPAPGEWHLMALDVGQGSAIVVETAQHTLVFDTGPRHRDGTDGAQRVLWPYLRARGIRQIDTLVVSHRDQDHVGGLDTLLRTVPVHSAYMPFNLTAWLHQEARRLRRQLAPMPGEFSSCVAGLGWEVDGVRFDFLHPQAPIRPGQRPNAQACVLLIRGQHHTALLPGDIGAAQEYRLVSYVPRIDVLVAPHHGSSTSSSWPFIQATQARHVIAQAGYLNRFHHPAASVMRRWHQGGAVFWRTDQHGAVMASSSSQGLAVQAYRNKARRYWHARDTAIN